MQALRFSSKATLLTIRFRGSGNSNQPTITHDQQADCPGSYAFDNYPDAHAPDTPVLSAAMTLRIAPRPKAAVQVRNQIVSMR